MAKFLAGLRPEYENVRAAILPNSEVPLLHEVHSQVQGMFLNSNSVALSDKSTLASSGKVESFIFC